MGLFDALKAEYSNQRRNSELERLRSQLHHEEEVLADLYANHQAIAPNRNLIRGMASLLVATDELLDNDRATFGSARQPIPDDAVAPLAQPGEGLQDVRERWSAHLDSIWAALSNWNMSDMGNANEYQRWREISGVWFRYVHLKTEEEKAKNPLEIPPWEELDTRAWTKFVKDLASRRS
jgi:hypothetical protein